MRQYKVQKDWSHRFWCSNKIFIFFRAITFNYSLQRIVRLSSVNFDAEKCFLRQITIIRVAKNNEDFIS